ncbi:His-Xaa-Ser system radical SAM maturase HxsB [Candidatus Woesearchaeota archaeon]|nr:His-Xaa-Ser system radical SAM maturase HxsB [Candidatus Woesearchaeota archaeon]
MKKKLDAAGYIVNYFRYKDTGKGVLATTDHGSWIVLNKDEFRQLEEGSITDKALFEKLEDKGFLVTEGNKERIKDDYRKRFYFLKTGPSLHIIVTTLRCNQKCIYCQTSSTGKDNKGFDMDEETAKKTVDFIFNTPSESINIEYQGGEPLLNFRIIRLITDYARELNRKKKKRLGFSLVTNLTLMTDEILDYCIANRIFICTSLDGPKDIHDKNRWFEGSSHELVCSWIKKINDEYEKREIDYTRMNALITVTKATLSKPKEVVDEYVRLGLSSIHLRFLTKLGYAKKNRKEIEYDAGEFISFWKRAVDHIIELNRKGNYFTERSIMIILRKILQKSDPNYLDMRSPCGAVIGQLAYNYNGDIYSCDEGRMLSDDTFMIGNVMTDTYKKVMLSPESCAIVASSINDSQICDYCVYKPYCGLCPVCNYAEQGSTIGIVPMTTFCKVYKAQFDYVFEKYNNDKDAKEIFDSWITKTDQ